jgi:predicted SprT family Zn-dependent metalloprotease
MYAKPFDFDWSGNQTREMKVLFQLSNALKFYANMGILPTSNPVRPVINRRSKRVAGWFKKRGNNVSVEISAWLIRDNSFQEIENTIKHEIAHAIAWYCYGKDCGHNHLWRAIAISIGDDGARCYDSKKVVNNNNFKYTLVTDCCGMKVGRTRITANVRKGIERGTRTFSCCSAPRRERTIKIIQNY